MSLGDAGISDELLDPRSIGQSVRFRRSASGDELTEGGAIRGPNRRMRRIIAVTGACGFIGSATVNRLAATGNRVVAVDVPMALGRYVRRTPAVDLISHSTFVEGLRHGRLARRLDALVHLAACTDTQAPWEVVNEVNLSLSRHLLEWATSASIPFVYCLQRLGVRQQRGP